MPTQPLQENAVEIPILAMDQKPPATGGPVGRIQRLVNGVVDKYKRAGATASAAASDSYLRITDRPAWVAMPRTTADPYNGGHSGTSGIPSPSVSGNLGEQAFMIGSDSIPYVYSPASQAWEKFSNETVLTNRMSLSPITSQTARIQCPDAATIGNVHCYVWQQANQGWCMILDDDGTPIRTAFVIQGAGRIKVAADANFFYVFGDGNGTSIAVVAFTSTGAFAAGSSAVTTLHAAGDSWDVTYQSDVAIVALCRRGSVASAAQGVTIVTVVNTAGTIVATSNSNVVPPWGNGPDGVHDAGGGFITNQTSDGFLYVAFLVSGDGYTMYVVKVNLAVTVSHTYQPIQSGSPIFGIVNISGHVTNGSVVWAMVSHLPYTGVAPGTIYQSNAYTELGHATTSTDALGPLTLHSLMLASRVFFVGTIPVAYMYYASVPSFSSLNFVENGQPTFFIARADTAAIVGRLFHGTAAMDWTWNAWNGTDSPPPNAFQLPTPRLKSDFSYVVSLGQTGAQQVQQSVDQGGIVAVNTFVSTVGAVDVILGKPGLCVELPKETLVPGPLPRSFDGISFQASGIELSPEEGQVADSGTSGHFNAGEVYSWVVVYARRDRYGRPVRSGSTAFPLYTVGATLTNRSASLTIPTLRATTHPDVIIEVYRTMWVNGQQGTTHRKVSNDLAPLKNDTTVDTVTFVDSTDNSGTGEILYGGTGAIPASLGGGDGQEVDHDPPPPYSVGCVFNNIVFLLGYDNTVWFSLPGQITQPYAFGEGIFQMSVATDDQLTAIDIMDGRIIIGAITSIWFADQGAFLDATGAGVIPTPLRLPIAHGFTGPEEFCPAGIIYESSAGGFYVLGRDLTSTFIGAQVEDEMTSNVTILSSVADAGQRIYFLTSSNTVLVYDITFGGWWIYTLPTQALLLGIFGGAVIYADGTDVGLLNPNAVADVMGGVTAKAPKVLTFAPWCFADSTMVWDIDLFCLGGTGYSLTVGVSYDLDAGRTELFPPFPAASTIVDGSGRCRFPFQPSQPECSYIQLSVSDSFPLGVAPGFQLDKIVATVGVLPGAKRSNIGQRIQP